MTTNATVEARHKDEAAQPMNWLASTNAHAQALANLEAARAENADLTNRLAEIDRQLGMYSCSACDVARKLASGHTPSPCPGCAAKDEELAAMRADLVQVGEIAETHWKVPVFQLAIRDIAAKYRPPADPLAEALKAEALAIVLAESIRRTDHQIEAIRSGQAGQGKVELALAALKRGMELSRLGGAK